MAERPDGVAADPAQGGEPRDGRGPTMDEWVARVGVALHLPAEHTSRQTRDAILELARDVAHGVARPAAPFATFLLGAAVGGGADLAAASAQLRALIDPPS